mmetsp:Transcript_27517/g.40657  ORF Transcript_27517/g.40657 Transcript_27517/m.40657 type:complete len:111 (+) Transcript_27517:530-862(+)
MGIQSTLRRVDRSACQHCFSSNTTSYGRRVAVDSQNETGTIVPSGWLYGSTIDEGTTCLSSKRTESFFPGCLDYPIIEYAHTHMFVPFKIQSMPTQQHACNQQQQKHIER